MSSNPFIKPLKPFDPKSDLTVKESFKSFISQSGGDALSDLEAEEDDNVNQQQGKEFCSIKTGGPILADVVYAGSLGNRDIFLISNTKGEIYFLSPADETFTILGKFSIQGQIIRPPAYVDGVLYCTTREGLLYAIHAVPKGEADKIQPEIIWKKKFGKGILTEPIATGKILIVATLGGIYGFEAYYRDREHKSIGKPLWRKQVKGIVSTPVVHEGALYFGCEDKHIYAIDYGSKKSNLLWKYKCTDSVRSRPCVSVHRDLLAFSSIDGYIYAINRLTGEYRWSFVTRAPILSSVVSSVIGRDEYFFAGADDGKFYCLNSRGKEVWSFKASGRIRTDALIDGSRIYFGSEDNSLYCLNAASGKEIFRFATDGNINSKPVVRNNLLVFGSSDSFVHGIHI